MDKEYSMTKNITLKKENIIILCLTILVFLISIRHLGSIGIFTVLDDEFGYWGNAAYLAGLDWSDAVSQIPYYSYGYSLLLVPLFWIFDNSILMYKAAIILNGIMLSASFLLCYDIARKLMSDVDKYILIAISFFISMYPAYIAYSSIAWCECLLIFACWMLTWCFAGLNEKSSNYKFILIGFLSIYAYIIHQRALGILIASISVILLMKIFNKINWKQFLYVFLPFFLLMIIHFYLKNDIQSHLWLNNSGNLTNDYSAQASKFTQLFSIYGLGKAFKIFLGQFFYLGTASYLLCYLGIYELIQKIGRTITAYIKKKDSNLLNSDYYFYLYVFLLIALFFSIVISVISKINPTRIDHIVYGRYTEMILGPIILLGFIKFRETITAKVLLVMLISFSFITVAVNFILQEFNLSFYNPLHAVGLLLMNTPLNVYLSALIAILLFRLIFISFTKNNGIIITTIIFITGLFFFTGEIVTRSIVDINQERMEITKVVDSIYTSEDKLPIYFLWNDQNDPVYDEWDNRNVLDRLMADCYQFLLKENKIKLVNNKQLKITEEDKFILSGEIYNLFDLMHDYKFCLSAADSYLLVSKTNDFANNIFDDHPINYNAINIPLGIFNVTNAIATENYVQGDGTQGIFMQGPYKKLKQGEYIFILDMELIDYKYKELGYVDVYSSMDEKVLSQEQININNFDEDTKLLLEVPFELERDTDYIGLRIYANEDTQLKINSVYIKREQG